MNALRDRLAAIIEAAEENSKEHPLVGATTHEIVDAIMGSEEFGWPFYEELEGALPQLPAGVYQYKEKPYLLICLARIHYTDTPVVVYVPLYQHPRGGLPVSVRSIWDFAEKFTYYGPALA